VGTGRLRDAAFHPERLGARLSASAAAAVRGRSARWILLAILYYAAFMALVPFEVLARQRWERLLEGSVFALCALALTAAIDRRRRHQEALVSNPSRLGDWPGMSPGGSTSVSRTANGSRWLLS
jgi:hypothetical protein